MKKIENLEHGLHSFCGFGTTEMLTLCASLFRLTADPCWSTSQVSLHRCPQFPLVINRGAWLSSPFLQQLLMIVLVYQSPAPTYFYQKDIVDITSFNGKQLTLSVAMFHSYVRHSWSVQLSELSPYLVGGDCNMNFIFPFTWECHHPNGRTLIFFRGLGFNHQPVYIYIPMAIES